MSKRRMNPNLTRRTFLQATGLAGGGAVLGLTACSDDDGPEVDEERTETIEIPDTGAELPEDDVTLRWLGTPDSMAGFIDEFTVKYEAAHPNISIEYDGLPNDKIAEVLPLGVENGEAHDIFSAPPTIQPADLVARGWVAPLDDIIPNFEEWKAGYPENTFLEGINTFDGKVYNLPLKGGGTYEHVVLSNNEVLQQADVDPATGFATFDDLRESVRKITEAGEGQMYGIVLPGIRLAAYAHAFSHLAGVPHERRGIDPLTGTYIYDTDAYREAVDFLLALQADGSVFPGSIALTGQEATPRVVQGNAGVVIDGEWTVRQWLTDEPDFEFNVAGLPALSSGDDMPLGRKPGDGGSWAYADSPNLAVVGDIFSYLGSTEGQTAFGLLRGVAGAPVHPAAREALREQADDITKAVLDMKDSFVLSPEPVIRNPETIAVFAELKPPTPNVQATLEAIMVGDVAPDDIGSELTKLADRYNTALDDAIAAAQKNGANVSRDDWVFPNYDPTRDYGEADYAAL